MSGPPGAVVSVIVLAAGTSSRLGRPKQLADLEGRPLLQHVVDAALAAPVDEVVVVLGHAAREVATAVPARGRARHAVNPDFAEGQSTSLRAGLRAVDAGARAVVILLGDQPGVRPEAIAAVVRSWRERPAPVHQASYQGRPGHPTLIGRALWPELEALRGDEGARSVIQRHRERRRLVEVGGDPPDDVDTEEDLRRVTAGRGGRSGRAEDA